MKKILLLGGSSQQVPAIITAKQKGYYTILCDYLPDNPGRQVADKYYLVSTTDKEKVLEVAQAEDIDGIVAYSSDPAAPTAAYVANKMSLPGVPYSIANTFCNKHLFRKFLSENNFNVPESVILGGEDEGDISNLIYPLIVKPSDSSGSKGVSVIYNQSDLKKAIEFAEKYSRNKTVVAEEFITRDHRDVIEAEIFVVNNKVTVWGLINSVRDTHTNPLLPATYTYPLQISDERLHLVKSEISRLIQVSKIQYGALNMEMVITKDNRLYFLDVGPRNGGNMLPLLMGKISGSDIVGATIDASLGITEKLVNLSLDGKSGGYWALCVLHTDHSGVFNNLIYSEEIKKYLVEDHLFVKKGDIVAPYQNSLDAIGLAFFKFPNEEIRDRLVRDFDGRNILVKTIKEG